MTIEKFEQDETLGVEKNSEGDLRGQEKQLTEEVHALKTGNFELKTLLKLADHLKKGDS